MTRTQYAKIFSDIGERLERVVRGEESFKLESEVGDVYRELLHLLIDDLKYESLESYIRTQLYTLLRPVINNFESPIDIVEALQSFMINVFLDDSYFSIGYVKFIPETSDWVPCSKDDKEAEQQVKWSGYEEGSQDIKKFKKYFEKLKKESEKWFNRYHAKTKTDNPT